MDIPTDCERLGAVFAGQVEPVMPWVDDAATGKRRPGTVQETDPATGHPLWVVHCMIAAGERPTLMAVRVPAPQCPEPAPFSPAMFERLVATTRVHKQTGQLATYWTAAGIADPRHARQHKSQEQQAA